MSKSRRAILALRFLPWFFLSRDDLFADAYFFSTFHLIVPVCLVYLVAILTRLSPFSTTVQRNGSVLKTAPPPIPSGPANLAH